MKGMTLFVALVVIILFISSSAVNCESDGDGQWQTLTKQNFSSQIRLHPHVLVLVSVPWSGESRSLMKEISRLVSDRLEEFESLKLMYMQRNKEKLLADAIGATEGIITILYYHHSSSYKYQGKLIAGNILSSIVPYMSVSPHEIPLKALKTQEELKMFLDSTDKALILLEFCGWTPELMARKKRNATGDFAVAGFNGDAARIPVPGGKENQKGIEIASLKCSAQDGFGGIPWLGEFSSVNGSSPFHDTDNVKPTVGLSSCTFEEFQQFDSFLSGFINVAREFFLPSERYRFGLVSEISLLSSLGVGDSGSWSTMLYVNGCPSCSKVLKEGDDLKNVLLMGESMVTELEGNGQDLDPAVPASKPSLLLFVDRFSNSAETKRRSKEALDTFRTLALEYQISDQIDQQNSDKPERSSAQLISGHPRLKLSPMAQKIKLKEKMSVTILNEGKYTIRGSSLHEILTYLLQQNKEAKLSSIAKDVGFQLLSDDFDIKTDKLPSEPQVESSEVSAIVSEEDLAKSSANLDEDSASNHDQSYQPTDIECPSPNDEEDISRHLISTKPDQPVSGDGLAISVVSAEEKVSIQVDQLKEEQHQFQSFKGSFFFSDGNYRLLRALTGETKVPSLVIIDPISQQHYVPEQKNFGYASLEDSIHRFLNGILTPYQQSESEPENPREGTRPPFVNVDFHEADSIPRVTVRTFTEQVFGFNQSDDDNAWKEDVLVLFSNSWCGFCQRMELVVREVYRAIKGHMNMLKTGSWNGESETVVNDSLKNNNMKFPKIFLMECTLNDCSLILKSANQREVYPALLLFPAERKTSVSYEGDMAVADVIKFMAVHGSSSQHLTNEKGILWTLAEKSSKSHSKDVLPSTVRKDAPVGKGKYHEVLLKNRTPRRSVDFSDIKSHASKDFHETIPNVLVGSTLVATEKLAMPPFDKSMVLIVKANKNTGFQGLIYNKLIKWESLDDLEKGFELLKEAPLSFGGPLIRRGAPFVALTRRLIKDQLPEVASGIYFLDQKATLHEIEELKSGNQSIADYWFFYGYASWGWDQLYEEIAGGAWYISMDNMGQLEWPGSHV
ncbi:hypothetical protein MANES_11G108701v8 [Manihot esculenta]|uniref:Uncharacterized protein n=1 Tax=Manihot esculenta TaxID=3983 RepID=A0ACB7GW75_MANES|nr:hypothetical protein MANES_11G108701v8 [Manihot esculenta]